MTKHRVMNIAIAVIVGLAIIGLSSQLINDPLHFFLTALITVVIAAVLIWVFRRFMFQYSTGPGANSKTDANYKKAVKQSNQKYKKAPPKKQDPQRLLNKSQTNSSTKKRKNRPTHLRVIQGKKSDPPPKKNAR
ncbi:SA1362 family protein [Aureibacillus halotolerans]|uniref:Uncharacterized protein n=1 Tax=Aureibacillus halotolerans TaxID=1508390 RepID=A0A4R6U7K4_9BACI|nr:SA1362 family protein [Aureibacillus halotolerans]TDQ41662.1 hypothetical protein EV213_103241 [Aureibacillus halotolerans]